MTARQIAQKLQNAGVTLDGLTISKDEVEVYIPTKDGELNDLKTRSTMRKVTQVLGFSAFRCASGAWVCHRGANHLDAGNCL